MPELLLVGGFVLAANGNAGWFLGLAMRRSLLHSSVKSNFCLPPDRQQMLEKILLCIHQCLPLLKSILPSLFPCKRILNIVVAGVEFDLLKSLLRDTDGIVCRLVACPEVFVRGSVEVDCWCCDVHCSFSCWFVGR